MKTTAVLFAIALAATPALKAESGPLGGILPTQLLDANGKKIDSSVLEGKHVALYFSAHWCPPCRAFTPSLVKFHKANAGDDFEIVFVSLDNSDREMKGYIREMKMKWLAIPGARSNEANSLASRFQVRGIPALVVLAPDGTVITPNGRDDVAASPDTALAKWKEKNP